MKAELWVLIATNEIVKLTVSSDPSFLFIATLDGKLRAKLSQKELQFFSKTLRPLNDIERILCDLETQ